jgi:hypothetical protein
MYRHHGFQRIFFNYWRTLIDIRDNVFKVASRNIKAAQEKQKRDYDRRNLVAEHSYTVGPG